MQELDHAQPYDTDARVYEVANCAITVWSLIDWLFDGVTDAQKAQLATEWGKPIETLADFQTCMRENCRDIHRCRQVATGAKHRAVTKRNDPEISTTLSAAPILQRDAFQSDAFQIDGPLEPKIVDGDERLLSIAVLYGAYRFIELLIDRLKIDPEPEIF
jgi:hypothetical protein